MIQRSPRPRRETETHQKSGKPNVHRENASEGFPIFMTEATATIWKVNCIEAEVNTFFGSQLI
jgi:hypothetical protein